MLLEMQLERSKSLQFSLLGHTLAALLVDSYSLVLAGRPSIVTCTTFLGKGPSLPQGSWWCVLRVRSSCLSTEGSRVVYQLENLWVQLASQSFLVGYPSCTVVPSHSSTLLFCILFPLFSTSWVLFPHPIHLPPSCSPLSPFVFCPSHQLLALHSFFCPFTPFLGFPLRVTSHFSPLSFHPLMHCLFLGD